MRPVINRLHKINGIWKPVPILRTFRGMDLQLFAGNVYHIDHNASDDSGDGSKGSPWKRCPGMVGFAGSYSHVAGDSFIFKGGVTWPAAVLPLSIANSGISGTRDSYTVDDTWYNGGSFTQPIFDAEWTDEHCINTNSKDWLTFSYLTCKKTAGVDGRCVYIYKSSNTTCSYMNILDFKEGDGWYVNGGSVTHDVNNILEYSHIENLDGVYNEQTDTVYFQYTDDTIIRYNTIIYNYQGTTVPHSDAMHINHNDGGKIYGNIIKTEGVDEYAVNNNNVIMGYIDGTWVFYNNVILGSHGMPYHAFQIREDGGYTCALRMWNNYIEGRMAYGVGSQVVEITNLADVKLKNNIFVSNGTSGLCVKSNDGFNNNADVDNNAWYRASGSDLLNDGGNKTWAELVAAGYEPSGDGFNGDPKVDEADDYKLESDSGCIDKGVDLSSVFTVDRFETTRPINSVWDIGPHEYGTPPPAGDKMLLLLKS